MRRNAILRGFKGLIGWPRTHRNVLAEQGVSFRGCGFMGPVRIGYRSYGNDSFFRNCEIGRFCSIGRCCSIGAARHDTRVISTHPDFTPDGFDIGPTTRIGHDVWIGDNAVVMAGLTIGDGAVIGAGAVVTRDVAAYDIVAGVPARRLRSRFDVATVQTLLASQWWLYGNRVSSVARGRTGAEGLEVGDLTQADVVPPHHRPMVIQSS